ncbi:polar amino acid transport system permease protein [Arthrobacter sp. 754]
MTITTQKPETEVPVVPLRHVGRWVTGALILLAVVTFLWAAAGGRIDYASVPGFLFAPRLLEGLAGTVVLSVASMVAAVVLGTAIALLNLSENPVARWFAIAWIWLFRAIPALVLLLLLYNAALVFPRLTLQVPFAAGPFLDISTNDILTAATAAFVALALNESAYIAEIVRAGITSVDIGQTEASKSIGHTPFQRMSRVIIPQAMRVIVPPMGNNFIGLVKGSSIASVIGFVDLLRGSQIVASYNLLVIELLLAATIWYLIVVAVLTFLQALLERRIHGGSTRINMRKRIGRGLSTPPFMREKTDDPLT